LAKWRSLSSKSPRKKGNHQPNNFLIMATPGSPPSPNRSIRNAEGKDANAFYEKDSGQSQFGGSQFWGQTAPGVITDEEHDNTIPTASKTTEDMIDEGVTVDEAFKADVLACVTHMRATDGKAWHVSNVNSAVRNGDGSATLGLVLCSGDLCSMKNFTVTNGVVSEAKKSGGAFDWN